MLPNIHIRWNRANTLAVLALVVNEDFIIYTINATLQCNSHHIHYRYDHLYKYSIDVLIAPNLHRHLTYYVNTAY